MASTSTFSALNSLTDSSCDVFMTDCGSRNTFGTLLYRRLVLHGLQVFWYKKEMHEGDTFTSQIHDAIKSSSVHVAIFSPGYAESHWCLDKLFLMVESGKPIIPVFYGVQPTEVRQTQAGGGDGVQPTEVRQTQAREGVYAQALRNLGNALRNLGKQRAPEPRYNSTTIEKWRKALSTVAEISGLELHKFNGDEGELLDQVVVSVLQKLRKPRSLDVAEYSTSLDNRITDFENNVFSVQRQQSGKPLVIGILGPGGIGKTTLVKEFFHRKFSQFSVSSFLSHIKEEAIKSSLKSLQKKLLNDLTQRNEEIGCVEGGIELLKTRVSSNCQALVILDDVDHIDQLHVLLCPIRDVLHSNSLILITSRNRDVLMSEVQECSIYKLTRLNLQQSQELFCLHAFNQPHPLTGFEYLVDDYVDACEGLPLSLKVFGALLYGNHDKCFWEDRLERLGQLLPYGICKSLQISYDALHMDEKQIFLDIACFFIGKSKYTAIRIWDGCGWKGSQLFRSLMNKNLAEVDNENRIRLHDHLRDLGRDLARGPALPRRIWRTKDFEDLLQQSQVVTEVRGISLRWRELEYLPFPGCKIRNLQLLDINHDFPENYLWQSILNPLRSPNLIWLLHQSPNLIWLRLQDCGCSFVPSWIPMNKLRVLELVDRIGSLEELWQKGSQAPLQLRELRIDAPSFDIPKSIWQLKHLERIVISAAGIKD